MQTDRFCHAGRRHFIPILKRALFLAIAFIFIQLHASAQNVTLSTKGLSVKQIFAEIKKQTGYVVFSNKEILTKVKPVPVEVTNMSLLTFLDLLLKDQVDYTVQDKTIILSAKSVKQQPPASPTHYLHVQVIGSNGHPLPGASLTVKNRKMTGVTDEDGSFNITASEGDILTVSFIGYQTSSTTLNAGILSVGKLVVGLSPAIMTLENVNVVQTGYQTLSKERATGSFSKPDMKVFAQRSVATDVIGRLEGQIPGLNVTTSFETDVTTRQQTRTSLIRGTGSVSLNTNPLYVVDGVVVANLNVVNIDDIEDITVLKDAASAAIWGAKAANGVIVVKTKIGRKNQQVKFAYSGFTEFRGKPNIRYQRYLNSKQFIDLARETFDPVTNPYSNLTYDQVAPHEQILYAMAAGTITQAQANASLDSLAAIDNTSQVQNLIFANTITTNHNISASGGSGAYSFYSSLGFQSARGGLPGSNSNTYRVSLNQNYTPNDRLSISLNTQVSSVNTGDKNNFIYEPSLTPYQLFKDAKGHNLSMPYLASYYSPELRQMYQDMSGIDLQTYIPLDEINYAYTKSGSLMANIVGDATLKLWKGISFKGTYGYSTSPRTITYYEDHQKYSQRDKDVNFIPLDGSPSYIPLTGGKLETTNVGQYNWTARNQLLYEYNGRGGNDLLNIQVGQEANETVSRNSVATTLGWDNQLQTSPYVDYQMLNNGVFNTVTGSGFLGITPFTSTEVRSRFNSYFALASYRLNRKYSLDLSWRRDHSNLFGSSITAQNKPTYSVGGKWTLSNESFMEKITWINQLALRATYGITGNSPYTTATTYDVLSAEKYLSYPQVAGPSYTLSSPANRNLSWESTHTINLGLDFAVLNNRLSGSLEFYKRNTTDLLGDLPPDLFTGLSDITTNVGNIVNRGVNLNITSNNVQHTHFSWSTTFIFALNTNKLLTYTPPQSYQNETYGRLGTSYVVGYSYMPVFAYRYAGLDAVGDPQIRLANGKVTKDPQDPKAADLVYMGSSIPKFNGGISNTFTYKQFSLTLNMIYNLGAKMYRDVSNQYSGVLGVDNLPVDIENRWKKPGDEHITNVPAWVTDQTYDYSQRNTQFYAQGDINVISASYLKLRDATLNYDLPSVITRLFKIQGASIRAQINNVMLWKNNSYGIDPEYYVPRLGARTPMIGEHALAVGANINF